MRQKESAAGKQPATPALNSLAADQSTNGAIALYQPDTTTTLRSDIGSARGQLLLMESGDWGDSGSSPMDGAAKRFGATPPAGLVGLQDTATREIVAAVGFNPSLFQVGPAAAIRESWRLALFGVVSPLGRKVESELTAKLGPVSLGWQELKASDLSGRARAFQSMVGGGMPVDQAA